MIRELVSAACYIGFAAAGAFAVRQIIRDTRATWPRIVALLEEETTDADDT